MQNISEQELNDLLKADDAIQNFLLETSEEGTEYMELEKYISDMDDYYPASV